MTATSDALARDAAMAAAIGHRLAGVLARIRAAETRFGRAPDSVELLAVTKGHSAARIRAAHEAGQLAFGESYVREALTKQASLAGRPLRWHFIGRVQANKTRLIAEHFDWVHGLADLRHARRLAEQRPADRPPLCVCVQVNVSGESSKEGLPAAAVGAFLEALRPLAGLSVRGLMTLPAPLAEFAEQRHAFARLRALRDRLATPDVPLPTLSMGMSDDLEAAIAEGATCVRVGTAIFGARSAAVA